MDSSSLVMDEIEAGAEFLARIGERWPLKAACWLRRDESTERYLYTALEGLTPENSDDGYGDVSRIVEEMTGYIDQFRVKLIGPDHPVAKAVLEHYRNYPRKTPPRPSLMSIDAIELYVYPQPKNAA